MLISLPFLAIKSKCYSQNPIQPNGSLSFPLLKSYLLYPLQTLHSENGRDKSMPLKGKKGQGTQDGGILTRKAALYKQGFREITIWLLGSLNSTILILLWLRESATSTRLWERLSKPRIQCFIYFSNFCLVRFLKMSHTYLSPHIPENQMPLIHWTCQFRLCFQSRKLLYCIICFHSYHYILVTKFRLYKFITYI